MVSAPEEVLAAIGPEMDDQIQAFINRTIVTLAQVKAGELDEPHGFPDTLAAAVVLWKLRGTKDYRAELAIRASNAKYNLDKLKPDHPLRQLGRRLASGEIDKATASTVLDGASVWSPMRPPEDDDTRERILEDLLRVGIEDDAAEMVLLLAAGSRDPDRNRKLIAMAEFIQPIGTGYLVLKGKT